MGRFTQRERCNLALGPLGHMGKATAPSPRKWWVRPVNIGYNQTQFSNIPCLSQLHKVDSSLPASVMAWMCSYHCVIQLSFHGELREGASALCLHNTMSVLCATTQWHSSGSSRKELCSSLKLQLLWHGMVPCIESARARTVQHAGKAWPGIVNCASGCVCGGTQVDSGESTHPLLRTGKSCSKYRPISFSILATDAWWELAFFHGHLVGDKQNPVGHFGRVGSSAHMCCSVGVLQDSLQTVGLALYFM